MADTGFDLSEHIFLVLVVVVVLSPLISSINTLTLIQIIYFKIYIITDKKWCDIGDDDDAGTYSTNCVFRNLTHPRNPRFSGENKKQPIGIVVECAFLVGYLFDFYTKAINYIAKRGGCFSPEYTLLECSCGTSRWDMEMETKRG